jgi:Cys-rich protein (TIGR01571 family)
MGEWQQGLFGCFSNIGMCVFSFILPCYTHGKTAEVLGDNCLHCGLAILVPCFNIYTVAQTRGRVRENKSIEGTPTSDCLVSLFCAICVIIQHAAEMNAVTPLGSGQAIARV